MTFWNCESAMWPVPSIKINWNGLTVCQMFYISLDCMLFYRTHSHPFIQYQVNFSLFVHISKIDATHNRLLFRPFKVYSVQCSVCTLMLYTHILQVCYYCYYFILLCLSVYRSGNSSICIDSVCSCSYILERERERRNRHMRYDEANQQKHIFSYQCSFIDEPAGLTLAHTHTERYALHIGTYVKLECVVCGVCMKCSFHSQSQHCHSNGASGEIEQQHWATLRGRSYIALCLCVNRFAFAFIVYCSA